MRRVRLMLVLVAIICFVFGVKQAYSLESEAMVMEATGASSFLKPDLANTDETILVRDGTVRKIYRREDARDRDRIRDRREDVK